MVSTIRIELNWMWRKRIYFCCVVFYSYNNANDFPLFWKYIFLLTKQKTKKKAANWLSRRTHEQTNKQTNTWTLESNHFCFCAPKSPVGFAMLCRTVPCSVLLFRLLAQFQCFSLVFRYFQFARCRRFNESIELCWCLRIGKLFGGENEFSLIVAAAQIAHTHISSYHHCI